MRKFALARVSYRDDCFISYCVYIMTGSFHILLFEGTLHVDKIHVRLKKKSQTLRMHYPFQSTGRLISHRNMRSFRVYMITFRYFVLDRNFCAGATTGMNSRQGDLRRYDFCGGIM